MEVVLTPASSRVSSLDDEKESGAHEESMASLLPSRVSILGAKDETDALVSSLSLLVESTRARGQGGSG